MSGYESLMTSLYHISSLPAGGLGLNGCAGSMASGARARAGESMDGGDR